METEIENETDETETYGCEDCKFYSRHRCKLWQVAVVDAIDSHCECLQLAK